MATCKAKINSVVDWIEENCMHTVIEEIQNQEGDNK